MYTKSWFFTGFHGNKKANPHRIYGALSGNESRRRRRIAIERAESFFYEPEDVFEINLLFLQPRRRRRSDYIIVCTVRELYILLLLLLYCRYRCMHLQYTHI